MKKLIIITVILIWLPALALCQNTDEEDYTKYAGYVDFDKLDGFKKSDKSVTIYLKKPLLSLVAALTAEHYDF